nr:ABC transporter permease subunit [Alkalicoccus halolimnae]
MPATSTGFRRTGSRKLSSSVKGWLLAAPLLLFMLLFVGQGLFRAFQESMAFGGSEALFSSYEELLNDRTFWASFRISVYVAFTSTVFSLLIGLGLTRSLFRLFDTDRWKIIAWFPMLIPHFVGAYIVVLFFSPGGWFSSLTAEIGWIEGIRDFPIFVNDPLYIGVILTYIWKEVPFVVLMLLPVYQEIDWRMEEVGRSLGLRGWALFRAVEGPWVTAVLIEVFLILFVFIIGAFEVPALLGVTYPAMMPVLAFDWFYQAGWSERPLAQAMMVLLTAASVLLAFSLLYFSRKRRKKWLEGGGFHA